MYQADLPSIVRDPGARKSAETEFNGFTDIYSIRDWPEGCSAVRPLDYMSSYNAIVTQFVPSEDLFRQCRRAVTCGGAPASEHVHDSLGRCGTWLRHFQRSHDCRQTLRITSDQLLSDINGWAHAIKPLSIRPRLLDSLLHRLESNPWAQDVPKARTCEGFEVRNIIVDRGGTVRLVDPGLLSWSSGLEDVAHFLASLTMLYWGTPALWLGVPTAKSYRHSFFDAWNLQDLWLAPEILAWFETREWFRQWSEAYRVLSRKPYPPTLSRFLRAVYVDAFFLNRIQQTTAIACQ
jgi:hypothetical protein